MTSVMWFWLGVASLVVLPAGHPRPPQERPRLAMGATGWKPMSPPAGVPQWQEKGRPPVSERRDVKLGERLVHRAVADADEGLMESIARLMNEAARRLEIEFDAGDKTQALQRRVLDRLNHAVKVAASQRRTVGHRFETGATSADKRRMPKGRPRTPDERKRSPEDESDRASDVSAASLLRRATLRSGAASLTVEQGKSPGGDLRELRRSWGHLPMREREEIIQGITESFLERYREWIQRYYRALQETED